jgi:hypothetical protein
MAVRPAATAPEPGRRWKITFTPEAQRWYSGLPPEQKRTLEAGFDGLREQGPNLGRPLVAAIKGSRYHNMKELRSSSRHLRVLFAFGPNREAIMLVGGDKAGQWNKWYDSNVPTADRRYSEELRRIGKEAAWAPRHRNPGRSSDGRSR